MADTLRLLAVFPHPDDETLGLGGTLAKYSAEGVETYLVCATRGERGWFDSEGPDPGLEAVGHIREAELRCAAEQLGLREVSFLNNTIDGDVDKANPNEIIGSIVTHIRRIKPQVIVTFPPDGAYGHPDHIALSQFTAAAIVCAADGSFQSQPREMSHSGVSKGEREPHRVSKFYYMVDGQEIVELANEAFGGISMDVDGVTRNHVGWADWAITTRVNAQPYIETVHKAVLCHKSQLPGYGPLGASTAKEMSKWFGKGSFYRVFSLVNGGRNLESDLFEGLR
jgi:LmbE family N-acetylglucosaminyl deacetylase